VFATEGVNDYNVLGINFGSWWRALPASVPKMVWLAQTGHVDPFDFRRPAWVAELHRWFDHYLMGIDNGVQHDPPASVERAPDVWVNYPRWPIPGTRPVTWQLAGPSASFTDDPTRTDADWAADIVQSDRLSYRMAPLTHVETVSGTVSVTLTVTPSTSVARVSAVLVDYGTTTMRNYAGPGQGIRTLTTRSCWGDSTPEDSACYLDTAPDMVVVPADVFARGWADLGHYASKRTQRDLVPGRPVTITFPLNTTDHTIPAGHTLALLVGGTDAGYVDPPPGRPTITLDPAVSRVVLPLAGQP
jgi:X-Pro dipeptidyl-peptidase